MAEKMQTHDETRLLKRSPLSTTGIQDYELCSPNVKRNEIAYLFTTSCVEDSFKIGYQVFHEKRIAFK